MHRLAFQLGYMVVCKKEDLHHFFIKYILKHFSIFFFFFAHESTKPKNYISLLIRVPRCFFPKENTRQNLRHILALTIYVYTWGKAGSWWQRPFLSLTLGDHSAWSSFTIYGDTRQIVHGIFTFNFSYHFCAWISTFLWSSRPVLLVDQSTDNLIQLILNNPTAIELISSIKGDFPVIRYSLHYSTPGWFNY